MKLDKKTIEHIANLARLELDEKELKKYNEQLSDVLAYIDQLKEVDTAGVEPTAQVTGLINVMREDEIRECPKENINWALGQAPEIENNQIKVKRIL